MGILKREVDLSNKFEIMNINGENCINLLIEDIPESLLNKFNLKSGDSFYLDFHTDGSVEAVKAI